jgi:hypothetical protein
MSNTLHVGLRWSAALLCGAIVLAWTAPVVAEIKPLTKEEQAKIDKAIDKGVAFLKKAQTKQGDFVGKMHDDAFLVGQCAIPAYALLESGVPADDPVIQKAAAYLRPLVLVNAQTYELSLAILFFDRLGDPKDKILIQMCALRLIAGQHRTGGWSYRCPVMTDKNAADLLNGLAELNKRRKDGELTRSQAREGMEIPLALQVLTVFQPANRLPWRDSAESGSQLDSMTDNSNTQFALLGLWAARRHKVAVEPALEIAVERFERSQTDVGLWGYHYGGPLQPPGRARMSMNCVGLIGLAIGRGLKLPTLGSPLPGHKDVHVLRGLYALSRQIGKPRGNMKRVAHQDLYFLWALERAAMLFDLPDIGGKDWYRWGAEGLVANQNKRGFWNDPGTSQVSEEDVQAGADLAYKPLLCTSFALLFLKRSHPMKDLTAKHPFKAKELNEGITRLRPSDRYPLRPVTTPAPSREEKP